MQGTVKCILCCLTESLEILLALVTPIAACTLQQWSGRERALKMPRAIFQSCWHLIYEYGVCTPGISLIRWLSGLTSLMGIKGMISTGATGFKRQKYACTTMPVRFPFRDDVQGKTYIQESRCWGGQQAVQYFCSSSHSVWFLCSALHLVMVKKGEIRLAEDHAGDPFGRDLVQILAENLLGRVWWQSFLPWLIGEPEGECTAVHAQRG